MTGKGLITPQIYFDEAGNTGQNLLDVTQQVFTLASVGMVKEEAIDALAILTDGSKKPEVHFQDLKRTNKGKEKILRFLAQSMFTSEVVKLTLIHKPFMVTTKIVDLLIETLLYRDGIDLYERGGNIATANLIHTVMPVFVGDESFRRFLSNFVNMIRYKTRDEVEEFYNHVHALWLSNQGKDFEGFLATFLASSDIVLEVLAAADIVSLDPAVPSFVVLCDAWGNQLDRNFDVIHDSSKPIEHEKEILEILMSKDQPEVIVGYDIRKSVMPLKATGITFADSQHAPQLQVADVFSSSFAFWGNKIVNRTIDDGFWRELDSLNLPRFSVCDIWPSHDVTPEDLGTEEVGGINAVDYTADLIKRKRREK